MTEKNKLKVIPLGGLHEIGKNMFVFEIEAKKQKEIIIVDAGILYPGYDSPGVDYTLADFKYLQSNEASIKALILTSAHEAHCGGAQHLVNKLKIKNVVGSKLALELLKNELDDKQVKNINWQSFISREPIKLESFTVTPFYITSPSAENYACLIEAGGNKVFYSSSFKIDQSPSNQDKTDIFGLTTVGCRAFEQDEQIDLYIGDSANIEKEGYSKSELELTNKLRDIMISSAGRVIVNTYNSNTIRIQNLFNIAEQTGRKVALLNKDARESVSAAQKSGCLNYNDNNLISIKGSDNHKDTELLIIMTAPEGEALREMEKIAFDKSLELQLKEGDTVVNSGDLPPGTVRIMAQISDQFHLKKVKILGGRDAMVNVESHAMTEELKFMFNILRPKYFVPGIGETRHLIRHAKLAVETGFDPGAIFILDNGDVIEVFNKEVQVSQHINTNEILFNDFQDFHVDNKIVKERDGLAKEGVVTVSFSLNKKNKVVAGPVFSAKACTFSSNKEWRAFCLMNSQDIIATIENYGEENSSATIDNFQDAAREHINHIIKTQIGKKPAVIVLANQV